jgi:F0F1-type ATP synthase assembly protein I
MKLNVAIVILFGAVLFNILIKFLVKHGYGQYTAWFLLGALFIAFLWAVNNIRKRW